jgi:hypothetical protein
VTLTRRGAPDVPSVYVTDAYRMEGLAPTDARRAARRRGRKSPLPCVHITRGRNTEFQLLANQQGRLGQIRTVLRATSAEDAWKKTCRLLNPFLCDLL